jgi:aconitate hydratase
VFAGDEQWQSLPTPTGDTFAWDAESTYVRKPAVLRGHGRLAGARSSDIAGRAGAGQAGRLGDHRPHLAGQLDQGRLPAGKYLAEHGVARHEFNSYGSRRGNHEVMIRGTFANIRLRNQLVPAWRAASRSTT